jgi:hypothetical protein
MDRNENRKNGVANGESPVGVSQAEADRFNAAMEARNLPYRARVDTTGTPRFVVEPPLPASLVAADGADAGRARRREALVAQRDRSSDVQTRRRLDLMVDNHDRGSERRHGGAKTRRGAAS